VKAVLDPEGQVNEGTFAPVRLLTTKGTLVDAAYPAPVSGGNLETAQRIAGTVLAVLSQMVPEGVPADSCGSMNNVAGGGYDRAKDRDWVFYETIGGGAGAMDGCHGTSGVHCYMTNTMNTPIEAVEQYYPLRCVCYELRRNSGGKGQWRGGDGIRRGWQVLCPQAHFTVLGERVQEKPHGVKGGRPGSPSRYWILHRDGRRQQLASKASVELIRGESLVIETAGGGAFGKAEGRTRQGTGLD